MCVLTGLTAHAFIFLFYSRLNHLLTCKLTLIYKGSGWVLYFKSQAVLNWLVKMITTFKRNKKLFFFNYSSDRYWPQLTCKQRLYDSSLSTLVWEYLPDQNPYSIRTSVKDLLIWKASAVYKRLTDVPLRKRGFYLDYFLCVKVTSGAVWSEGWMRSTFFLVKFLKVS